MLKVLAVIINIGLYWKQQCGGSLAYLAASGAPGGRTLTLNTDLTEKEGGHGGRQGAANTYIYGEYMAIFIALNQYFKQF